MSPEQLSEERRRGLFAAVAAIVSGLAFVAGAIWYQAVNADAPDGKNEDADAPALLRPPRQRVPRRIDPPGLRDRCCWWWSRCTSIALPRPAIPTSRRWCWWSASAARSHLRASTLIRAVTYTILADDFAGRAVQTEAVADDLLDSPVLRRGGRARPDGRAGARVLARQGIAGRDARRASDALHGGDGHRARARRWCSASDCWCCRCGWSPWAFCSSVAGRAACRPRGPPAGRSRGRARVDAPRERAGAARGRRRAQRRGGRDRPRRAQAGRRSPEGDPHERVAVEQC